MACYSANNYQSRYDRYPGTRLCCSRACPKVSSLSSNVLVAATAFLRVVIGIDVCLMYERQRDRRRLRNQGNNFYTIVGNCDLDFSREVVVNEYIRSIKPSSLPNLKTSSMSKLYRPRLSNVQTSRDISRTVIYIFASEDKILCTSSRPIRAAWIIVFEGRFRR